MPPKLSKKPVDVFRAASAIAVTVAGSFAPKLPSLGLMVDIRLIWTTAKDAAFVRKNALAG